MFLRSPGKRGILRLTAFLALVKGLALLGLTVGWLALLGLTIGRLVRLRLTIGNLPGRTLRRLPNRSTIL